MGLLTRALATANSAGDRSLLRRAEELRSRADTEAASAQTGPDTTTVQLPSADSPAGAEAEPTPPPAHVEHEPTPPPAYVEPAETRADEDLQTVPEDGEQPDPEAAIRAILRDLPTLPESIEQPAHLFRLLVENLQLNRAAVLIPDYDEDVFVPWASNGLDATSLHRLRIPVGDLQSVAARSRTGAVWSGESVSVFAPYFSRREASMLEDLLVFPIESERGIEAVLLVTETPYFGNHTEYLRIILAAVGEPAARSIRENRLLYTATLARSIVFKPTEIPVIAERIASRAADRTILIAIQLSDLVSQVATSNLYLDPFRVWQDVLRAVAGLFASTASVCDANEQRALLLVHGDLADDLELIVGHVSASLASLFTEIEAAPVLRYDTRRYPADGEDVVALAQSLL